MIGLKAAAFLTMVSLAVCTGTADEGTDFVIDRFSSPDARSDIETYWQLSTDRVMGGISEGKAYLTPKNETGEQYILKLSGEVRLENNGGFIQVRLPLTSGNRPFDASEYSGIALQVRGNGEQYYIHLRTTQSRFPWAYYYQAFTAPGEWARIELPFESFIGENIPSGGFREDLLVSLAIVAAKERMNADIEVSRVSLYR